MARSFESDANDNNLVKRSDSTSTYLEHKQIPVTTSCSELMDAMEEFKGDIPATVEILRRSSVDFTDNQQVLVNDVMEAAELENRYGFDRQFYFALITLGDSLDLRIKEEEKFFFLQKKHYTEIYEILRHSTFPYSSTQVACLSRMVRALSVVTGHPSSEADREFRSELRELVRLLHLNEHLMDRTPNRFMLTNTIDYYLQEMVTKLDRLAKEELDLRHPDFIPLHCDIDLGTYLLINLEVLVDKNKVLTPREHFHHGMVEVYTRLVDIFKSSRLEFSVVLKEALRGIEDKVNELSNDPLMVNHNGVVFACVEFIRRLEENYPSREVKLNGNDVVWDEEGKVNKAVREIGWNLIYLQPVVTEHLSNFICFGKGVENVVAQVTDRFLTLYPMN